jgi:hypothetical protein
LKNTADHNEKPCLIQGFRLNLLAASGLFFSLLFDPAQGQQTTGNFLQNTNAIALPSPMTITSKL